MKRESKRQRGIYEKVRGSGIWWIRYADHTGRIRREKSGNKGAAIALYSKRKTQVLQGRKLPENLRTKAVSFSVIADSALQYSRTHKVSYQHDEYRMAKLKEVFGSRSAENILPQDIESWFADHSDWKPATANRYRALLSLTYRLAIQNGRVATNPARLVRHRRENNARLRWLSDEEEKQLRKTLTAGLQHHVPELDLALNTGMRRSELYSLTWENVDFERTLATVPQCKNGETRHVPLNAAAIGALKTIRLRSLGIGRVFINDSGQPVNSARQWFEKAVKDAKLKDFTWHCLRHTFASRLAMAGVDLRTIQELMGHKTINMTCRYAHLAPSHKLAAVEKLGLNVVPQSAPTDTTTDTVAIETVKTDSAAEQQMAC